MAIPAQMPAVMFHERERDPGVPSGQGALPVSTAQIAASSQHAAGTSLMGWTADIAKTGSTATSAAANTPVKRSDDLRPMRYASANVT